MQFVTETITPEKATQYLQTNTKNRPLSRIFVRSYADTMRKGKWLLNGVPIIFDNEGRLIDGQHRLQAVVEAGIPVKFDVARGASPDAFTTYDCGRHRNLSQLIGMQGVKNYTLTAAIVASNRSLVTTGRLQANNAKGSQQKKLTNDDYYEIFSLDPAGYERVAAIITNISDGKTRMLSGSWSGGMYYYLTHVGGYSEECVSDFFKDVYFLTNNSPVVMKLRNMLQKAAMSEKKYKAEMLWALLAKTWNFYVKGECPTRIVFDPEKEALPKLKLKQ
jgi:hypothetical protein